MVKLKDGMGDKLSVVANLIGSFIFCFFQAFPIGWELSLACSTLLPFSIAAIIALTKVSIIEKNLNIQKVCSSSFIKFNYKFKEVIFLYIFIYIVTVCPHSHDKVLYSKIRTLNICIYFYYYT